MNNTEVKLTYSNPRKNVVIDNWPLGREKRGTAVFEVESNNKGERAVRTTTGKPKKLTYAGKVCFADGSDGRLYVLELSAHYGMISVMKGTFDYNHETIHQSSDPERFTQVLELIKNAV